MTLLVCSILFVSNVGGLNMETRGDVEGKLVKEGDTKYIVDFSEDLAKRGAVNPQNYTKTLVDKNDCVKE